MIRRRKTQELNAQILSETQIDEAQAEKLVSSFLEQAPEVPDIVMQQITRLQRSLNGLPPVGTSFGKPYQPRIYNNTYSESQPKNKKRKFTDEDENNGAVAYDTGDMDAEDQTAPSTKKLSKDQKKKQKKERRKLEKKAKQQKKKEGAKDDSGDEDDSSDSDSE